MSEPTADQLAAHKALMDADPGVQSALAELRVEAVSEHRPGDVAIISHTDGTTRRAMCAPDGSWVCFDLLSGGHTPLPEEIHPLIVVDVEDLEQLKPMHAALKEITDSGWYYDEIQTVLRALGDGPVSGSSARRVIQDAPQA